MVVRNTPEETGNETLTRYFSLRSSSLLVKDAFKSPSGRLLGSFLREFLSIRREEEEDEGEEKDGMDLAEEEKEEEAEEEAEAEAEA